MVVFGAPRVAIFEVVAHLDHCGVEHLERVDVVVLGEHSARASRYHKEAFIVKVEVLAETVRELLDLMVEHRH